MNKVLAVLLNWVGYLEKKSNKDLDHKTDNAGNKNYTCFARDYKEYTGANFQGQAWCAMFISCCFVAAYGLEMAKKLLCGQLYAYCPYGMKAFKDKGQLHTKPKAGDIVFFLTNGVAKHTGFVYKVAGNYIYTIEGNTSGASGVIPNGGGVCKKYYAVNSNMRFGRPDYNLVEKQSTNSQKADTATKQDTANKSTSVKIDAATSKDKALAGTYKVTASSLNMRAGAGTNKEIVDVLANGTEVQCYGYYTTVSNVKWLLVAAGKTTGFVSSKYLAKV